MGTEQKFDINDGNAGSIFKEKVNSIFGCLDDLEQKHWEKCEQVIEKSCANEPVDNPMNKRPNHVPRSQEKDFKKPFLPRGKRRGKKPPDYVTNPSKWTKYRLVTIYVFQGLYLRYRSSHIQGYTQLLHCCFGYIWALS